MHRLLTSAALAAAFIASASAQEADPVRGAQLAEACVACHGQAGVSVESDIPNLAAQKEAYIAGQLTAFREGKRSNALMNAIAAALTNADIADLAAHFSALPGAAPGATGEGMAALDGTRVVFPSTYRNRFVKYHVIDFPDKKQVRHYWASPGAAEAAKTGKPMPSGTLILAEVFNARLGADGEPVTGADGHFAPGELAFYTAMQKIAAGGAPVPEIYRNENWRYAIFTAGRTHKAGTNEARCLACHKPQAAKDYVFTLEQLAAAAP